MKAFNDPEENSSSGLASSFSLTEKLVVEWRLLKRRSTATGRRYNNHDEHDQTGILTSGLPRFRLPDFRQWHWKFVSRYSGATVPDFHRVPCHLSHVGWKNHPLNFKERGKC
jgi:hypothetical protein